MLAQGRGRWAVSLKPKLIRSHYTGFARALKPCRIGLLFTHTNGDFGANFVKERSFAVPPPPAPISKVESYISNRWQCRIQTLRWWGGGRSSRPLDKGGRSPKNFFFVPLGWEGEPLGPLPWIRHWGVQYQTAFFGGTKAIRFSVNMT